MLKESYINRLKELAGILSENDNNTKIDELKELTYSSDNFLSDNEKFRKYFKGIQINDFKNQKFPDNDSEKTKEEILFLKKIRQNEEFVRDNDNIYYKFKKYFEENNIDFPKNLIKDLIEASSYFLMKIK